MLNAKLVLLLAAAAVCQSVPSLKLDGGVEANITDFPSLVTVHWCGVNEKCDPVGGGVIINEKWVLTASLLSEYAIKIIAGRDNLDQEGVVVPVYDRIRHPDYVNLGPNDIALLELEKPLTFNDRISPAKLPSANQKPSGSGNIAGFGNSYKKLTALYDQRIVSTEECQKALDNVQNMDHDLRADPLSNICTLGNQSNNCFEDQGGPLLQDGVVTGLLSWIIPYGCARPNAPNVYTNVTYYLDWINETIKNAD